MLRLEAGRNPLNSELTALIGELSTGSSAFGEDWADHHVHEHRTGRKIYHHPVVGDIDVTFDAFDMPGEPGLSICTYSVEDGTRRRQIHPARQLAATQAFDPEHRTDRVAGKTERT